MDTRTYLGPPEASHLERRRRSVETETFYKCWDRVMVLGDDNGNGHTGCVNALSWAKNGELLITGGDDKTVRLWRVDPYDVDRTFPFQTELVIHTGHHANIFNAQMLPHSCKIATVAGDHDIRIFDVESSVANGSRYRPTSLYRCHKDRVKRIVAEGPDTFLSVSEDGAVRQHDLRTPHTCRRQCPPPLTQMDHELFTLSMSPTTPYQYVVAGDGVYGYLFDRRFSTPPRHDSGNPKSATLTTCVLRFARRSAVANRPLRQHITGARVSPENGHEVLLSYSADAVYLFSTLDSPTEPEPHRVQARVPSNHTTSRKDPDTLDMLVSSLEGRSDEEAAIDLDDEDDAEELDYEERNEYSQLPVVLPRQRYVGARNVDTVKDVNFLGPSDDFVTSGSDDGNFFIWSKRDAKLLGIYEGDAHVVNVVESHPHLPLLAVSGIDTTIKLFAPTQGCSRFSRMQDVERIMEVNARPGRSFSLRRTDLARLLANAIAISGDHDGERIQADCPNQ